MSASKSTSETDVYYLARTYIVSEEPTKEIIDTAILSLQTQKAPTDLQGFCKITASEL